MILDENYRKCKKKIDFIKKEKPLTTRVGGFKLKKLKQTAIRADYENGCFRADSLLFIVFRFRGGHLRTCPTI